MKKLVLITTLFFVTLVLYSIIFADPPKTISLQGRITDNSGTPVSEMGSFGFTLRDGKNNASINISTYVNRGLYSVNINVVDLSPSIDFSSAVSIDVNYNGTPLGTTQLTASPYAFWSASSTYASYASSAGLSANVATATWATTATWVTGEIDGSQIADNRSSTIPYQIFVASAIYAYTATYVFTSAADLAEIYSSKESLEPGDVVVISQDIDNNIEKSKLPDSVRVAGVISTEPGLVINSKEQGYQLALVGKVPVKVTNESGSIIRGDLLTTSSIPGHAKKAFNPKTGSVIGKALENFSGTKGTILVLVNLQ